MLRVHLVTFNHLEYGIVDHIRFLKKLFRHIGVNFTWGGGFDSDALNIFIECTTRFDNEIVFEFHRRTGKRYAFLMSEHIQIKDKVIYFNTIPSNMAVADDYMGQANAFGRFLNFMEIIKYSRKLYTIADLPDTTFIAQLGISKSAQSLPYPPVKHFSDSGAPRKREFDFVFTGARTAYRDKVLKTLDRHFKVGSLRIAANERQRGELYRNASYVLNIPQNKQWGWTSPMRILAALSYGRTIVSLQTKPVSEIDAFAIHIEGEDIVDAMTALLDQGAAESERKIISGYNSTMSAPSRWASLRGDLADWAIEEGLA